MKDLFLTVVAGIVSINLLFAVTELKAVSMELKAMEKIEMMQNPNHEEDIIVERFQNDYTDKELVEILGL